MLDENLVKDLDLSGILSEVDFLFTPKFRSPNSNILPPNLRSTQISLITNFIKPIFLRTDRHMSSPELVRHYATSQNHIHPIHRSFCMSSLYAEPALGCARPQSHAGGEARIYSTLH